VNLPDIAFSCVLGLAAMLVQMTGGRARPAARAYLRLAAILYFALAVADVAAAWFAIAMTASVAQTAALLVCALAPALLALATFSAFETLPRAWIAALVLAFACMVALAAAMSFSPKLAFAPLFCSVCAILALAARRWRKDRRGPFIVIIAALCLVAGAASSLTDGSAGRTALALFSAASLLGFSLAFARRSHKRVGVQREMSGAIPIRARR
jgi:hypothetical protein